MDSTKLKAIAIATIATLIAIWLGMNAATAQIETIMWVMGVGTIVVCAMLGRKVWMIIPFAMALNVTLMIPGRPTTLLLAQALFCGFCGLLLLLRRLPLKIRFTELDFWILLITLCVAQAYLRNPVGLNIFGGESLGARPYAMYGAALMTCLFLSHLRIPAADLKWLLRIHIFGGLMNFATLTIGYFVTNIGVFVGSADAKSLSSTAYQEGTYGVEKATRIGFLGTFANNIALWVSTFKSPIKACFHPIWAPLVLFSFAFAALSGFRNEIVSVGLTYLVAIAYRGGFHSVVIACVTLIISLAFLAIVNLATPLPANIQRSLSFLPGTWDESQVKDAKASTEWRVDMWKEALMTDHWIKNKILGDGLGMTREEHNYIQSFGTSFTRAQAASKANTLSRQQEFMMASNNYHSGPVSTIRTIGYIGLLILLMAQIRLAMSAHRQIKRAKNTEWFTLSLLIGIPIVWAPLFFTFIYGEFGSATASTLLGIAFVKMLQNNLPLELRTKTHPSKISQRPIPASS